MNIETKETITLKCNPHIFFIFFNNFNTNLSSINEKYPDDKKKTVQICSVPIAKWHNKQFETKAVILVFHDTHFWQIC